ncbi:PP2C family protein-serine/threonine phosphatase [Nocardiopsis sp. NPDC101807]|uniref:PP2C family protein-serine/threonine phosphatase n=1 Tax=Nocardiopsis sp. NPDC101807 TaxID=3364339 RepID=UPI0037F28A69
MTTVRTCPACSDRAAAGDVFCEGCGRPLPEQEGGAPVERADDVPTAPQQSMSGATRGPVGGGDAGGGPRPGLVPADGGPTAPQVSLNGAVRDPGAASQAAPPAEGGRPRGGGPAAGPGGRGADSFTTQPIRRDSLRPLSAAAPSAAAPSAAASSVPAPSATVSDWPPPAVGSSPVQPTNPEMCAWCPGRVGDGYCEKCGFLQPTGRDHVEVRTDEAAGVSDRGLRHRRNEDAMAIRVVAADDPRAPGTVCAVVCDGVSSSPRSDEASRVTAETGATVLAEQIRRGADPREATATAMTRAAEAVAGIAESLDSAPACTFVSAVVDPAAGTVTVGWVGDSRAYWLSGGPRSSASALLTRDDSWSEAMVQMGALSREEAMRSSNAHALIAWMGADSGEIDAHISTVTPIGPGTVLLCSDGLWNYYPEAQSLTDAVPGAGARPHEAARTYISLALRAGGKDNITAVLIPVPAERGGPRAEQD